MAGNYPDVPGPRMAYDRDGTVGFHSGDNLATVSQLPAVNVAAGNDEDNDAVVSIGGNTDNHWVGLIFPELRDLVGYFIGADYRAGQELPGALQTSPDTTTGLDGTWTQRANPYAFSAGIGTAYRNNITLLSVAGIKGIRMKYGDWGSTGYWNLIAWHLYGSPAAGQNPNRLRLWHPTLDQEVGGAYFDWGNAPRDTTADRTFRVRNNSATLTANTITVSLNAPTDTTPTNVGQHSLSSDGSTFAATASIASLAPGATSGILTLRRTTSGTAVTGPWVLRVLANAASWA